MYENRFYRNYSVTGTVPFQVSVKQSDLFVRADSDLSKGVSFGAPALAGAALGAVVPGLVTLGVTDELGLAEPFLLELPFLLTGGFFELLALALGAAPADRETP